MHEAILSTIQQHLDNGAQQLADEAAREAGLFVVACMSCGRVKEAFEAPRPGISHGVHEGACVAAYRAKYMGRVA